MNTIRFLLLTFLFATLYLLLVILLPNYRLVISDPNPLLLIALITGYFTLNAQATPIALSLLVGANISLILQLIARVRSLGKTQITIGGGMLLGVGTSACVGCGLSFLPIFGLALGSSLPFHGAELPTISFILLTLSILYLWRTYNKSLSCDIKVDKGSRKPCLPAGR